MNPDDVLVVLATHNSHKVEELRAILAPVLPPNQIAGAIDFGVPDVVEDGVSFAENALIKARAVARATGKIALADDSGLSVDVMNGAPGIFSARWAGTHGDDAANYQLLLAQLGDIPPKHRGAAFICAAALVSPYAPHSGDGASQAESGMFEHVELGELRGRLLTEPVGTNGFGYDPVLQPDGYEISSAQLKPEEKNAISHRGRAFRALIPVLNSVLAAAN